MAKKQTEQTELWERQPGEGPQAFKAFAAYRDSGADGKRRSLRKTAQSLTKRDGTPYSEGTLKGWSRKHQWQARVDAYDKEMDRLVQEDLRRGRSAMLKNHVGIAQAMMAKALQALQKIPPEDLDAQDIARIVDTASKLERISRGEATERVDGKQTIAGEMRAEAVLEIPKLDLKSLTDGELEQLGEIMGKLASE